MVTGFVLFVWGAVGAALAELINARALYERRRQQWNKDKKNREFWLFSILFAFAGGAFALAQEGVGSKLTALLAINVGFTWPLLLRRGIGGLPDAKYDSVD
jgi:hypothetical protein